MNLVDPEGLWIPQAIGAAIGIGFEGYSQYRSGNFNLGRLAMAGLTGAWGGFAGMGMKGMLGGAMRGGLGGAANNAYGQLSNGECDDFDSDQLLNSFAYGGLGGAFGSAGQHLGAGIPRNANHRYLQNVLFPHHRAFNGYPSYSNYGAAIGGATGSWIGMHYGN